MASIKPIAPWPQPPLDPLMSDGTQQFLNWVQQAVNTLIGTQQAPLAPGNVTAVGVTNGVLLNWASVPNASGYVVYENRVATLPSSVYASVPPNLTGGTNAFLDSGLVTSAKRYYAVAAVSRYGIPGASSMFVSATPVIPALQNATNLDGIPDGTTYQRPLATALTTGQVDLSKSGVIGKSLDNVVDSAGFKRIQSGTLAARPTAGTAGRLYNATDDGANGTIYRDTGTAWVKIAAGNLDDVQEGVTYQRPLATSLTSGQVDLAKAGVINKTLDNVVDSTGFKKIQSGTLAARPTAGTAGRLYNATDDGANGTIYRDTGTAWVKVAAGHLDDIQEGVTYQRCLATALTSGQVDLAKAGVINKVTDNLADGVGSPLSGGKRAFQALDANSRLSASTHLTSVNPASLLGGASPLSQSGTTTTIVVAAFSMQFPSGLVNYNSGSVNPGAYGKFYVYTDDPTFAGGAVTYATSSTLPPIVASEGRIYIGTITTASAGGGVGSGGGSRLLTI